MRVLPADVPAGEEGAAVLQAGLRSNPCSEGARALNFDDLPDEICSWCRRGFTGRRWDQKFCSIECQHRSRSTFSTAVKAEERRRARQGLTCERCGKPIDPTRSDAKWCSPACANDAYRDRQRGFCRVPSRCVECGAPITGRRLDALYCGSSCQRKAVYRRVRARRVNA